MAHGPDRSPSPREDGRPGPASPPRRSPDAKNVRSTRRVFGSRYCTTVTDGFTGKPDQADFSGGLPPGRGSGNSDVHRSIARCEYAFNDNYLCQLMRALTFLQVGLGSAGIRGPMRGSRSDLEPARRQGRRFRSTLCLGGVPGFAR